MIMFQLFALIFFKNTSKSNLKQNWTEHLHMWPTSGLISYHQSGCLAGWGRRSPKGPSEGRPAATWTPTSLICFYDSKLEVPSKHISDELIQTDNTGLGLPTLCGWDLAQFSSLAKTPSLHSMIQCSSMGKDSSLVAAMAMPKPISRTRPPTRQNEETCISCLITNKIPQSSLKFGFHL